MEQEKKSHKVALIVGVTGMVGVQLAEALKKPTALGSPWTVYGGSRRPLPTWFSSTLLDRYIIFDAINPEDTHEKISPLSSEITHLFFIGFVHFKNEERSITTNCAMLTHVLNALKSSPASPLCHVTLQTGTKHYTGLILDPSLSRQLLRPYVTPFREDSGRLPCPNFYYNLEDMVADRSFTQTFTYSIHRPSFILGATSRSKLNLVFGLSAYALICKEQGLPFRYPGNKYTWEHFVDMSDARIIAEQHIWASVMDKAKNQAFNCTNGDVFSWKSLWKVLCDLFDLEFLPFDDDDDKKENWVDFMKGKKKVWDEIVAKYGLEKTELEEDLYGAVSIGVHYDFQYVSNMNKCREFGFIRYEDTLKSIGFWVEKLRDMKVLP